MAALLSGDRQFPAEAAIYYLIAYSLTTVAAFAAVTLLAGQAGQGELELKHMRGLLWRQPAIALLMLAALLSLAGIPLTAGFIAKFYIVGAAVAGKNWVLLAALVVGSGIGIYYYLRVVFHMTERPGDSPTEPNDSWQATAVSCALIAGIVWLGVFPQTLMAYLRSIL
jgi:NADH-quinone oxidoreductase subunit N